MYNEYSTFINPRKWFASLTSANANPDDIVPPSLATYAQTFFPGPTQTDAGQSGGIPVKIRSPIFDRSWFRKQVKRVKTRGPNLAN